MLNERDKTVVIAAQIIAAEAELEAIKEHPLEDRLRAAMKSGSNFWMSTDDDVRFRGSIAAVMLHCSEGEREQLSEELRALRDLSALLSGVPVDIEQIKQPENPIGLVALWRDANHSESIGG